MGMTLNVCIYNGYSKQFNNIHLIKDNIVFDINMFLCTFYNANIVALTLLSEWFYGKTGSEGMFNAEIGK